VAAQPFELGALVWLDVEARMQREPAGVGSAAMITLLLGLYLLWPAPSAA